MGSTIVKPNAKKVRRIGEGVVAGFAGSAADGMSLLERLETKLEEHPGESKVLGEVGEGEPEVGRRGEAFAGRCGRG